MYPQTLTDWSQHETSKIIQWVVFLFADYCFLLLSWYLLFVTWSVLFVAGYLLFTTFCHFLLSADLPDYQKSWLSSHESYCEARGPICWHTWLPDIIPVDSKTDPVVFANSYIERTKRIRNFQIRERFPQPLGRCMLFATRKHTTNLQTLRQIVVPQSHIQSWIRTDNRSCMILASYRFFTRSRCWQHISSLDRNKKELL